LENASTDGVPIRHPRGMSTPTFIPGLELSRRFYFEAVRPLLDEAVPEIPYSAARIDSGSEVLGFDTARSADHEWGPRLQLFFSPQDVVQHGTRIHSLLSDRLPKLFYGYPTHFESTGEQGIGFMQVTDGPVRHRVAITDPAAWFIGQLGFDPFDGVSTADWLSAHTQRLAESTAARSSTTGSADSSRHARLWPGTRMTFGSISSPASGSASRRKRPSSVAAARSATSSAQPSSPPGWCAN